VLKIGKKKMKLLIPGPEEIRVAEVETPRFGGCIRTPYPGGGGNRNRPLPGEWQKFQ